jgi:hypothetical protein
VIRRLLPGGLGGLAGLVCALCCVVPLLLAAGLVGGTGWALFGQVLPGIAVALAAAAALAWWWARRGPPHAAGCDGADCACG